MEIIIQQHPQPKPILGVCFPQIFLPEHRIQHPQRKDIPPLALLKYFPKHIHSLPSNLSHLKTRIKRLKLVKRIPNDHPNHDLRVLLSNNTKNIQFAAGVENRKYKGGYNKQTLQLLKMFPNIQKVEFCVAVQTSEDEKYRKKQAKECYWIDKMSNYLKRMTNLKNLYLSNHALFLLPKFNTFETRLSRLEAFRLNFDLFCRPEDSLHARELFNFKTVLKHLTHLKLNLPNANDFLEVFQFLPDHCPRLFSLDYFICQPKSYSNIEEVSYLQCLQRFQNLQELSLHFSKKLDVLRHCKLPTSLRDLTLHFHNVDWKRLATKEAFYSNQEGLENLEKLKITLSYYHPIEEEEIIKDFLNDLLKRILTLIL